MNYYAVSKDDAYLMHYGVIGMKWGVRRYQNEDGSLTPQGHIHYLGHGPIKGRVEAYKRSRKEGKGRIQSYVESSYRRGVEVRGTKRANKGELRLRYLDKKADREKTKSGEISEKTKERIKKAFVSVERGHETYKKASKLAEVYEKRYLESIFLGVFAYPMNSKELKSIKLDVMNAGYEKGMENAEKYLDYKERKK
jgi:hypothetical protein